MSQGKKYAGLSGELAQGQRCAHDDKSALPFIPS